MPKTTWILLLAAGLCAASLTGCASLDKKSGKKKKQTAEKTEKRKVDTSWIREQFHHEQVSEQDINRRTLENFEVFPGRKGFRSRDLESREPIAF